MTKKILLFEDDLGSQFFLPISKKDFKDPNSDINQTIKFFLKRFYEFTGNIIIVDEAGYQSPFNPLIM